MSIELTSKPTQVQLTGTALEAILYNGTPVDELVYVPLDYGIELAVRHIGDRDEFSGQEVYLGYSPSKDRFYMAIEGNVLEESFDEDEEAEWSTMMSWVYEINPQNLLSSTYQLSTVSFYTREGDRGTLYEYIHKLLPDLLDIRLD